MLLCDKRERASEREQRRVAIRVVLEGPGEGSSMGARRLPSVADGLPAADRVRHNNEYRIGNGKQLGRQRWKCWRARGGLPSVAIFL